MRTWDVVVVGAGPGGSIAAHAAAASGASVLLLERAAFPRWKVCGACVSAGAVAALRRAGLAEVAQGVPLRSMVLAAGGRTVGLPLDGSLALSRAALDGALATAAVRRGAEFWPASGAALDGISATARRLVVAREEGRIHIGARVVIDATGLGRNLSDEGDRTAAVSPRSRVGLGATFDLPGYGVRRGGLHMAVGRSGYVGLVRVEDGSLNVAAAVDPVALRASGPGPVVDGILREAGKAPLAAPPSRGWRGTPPLTRSPADVGAERLLRLGDAAGYEEPFTGEGICWALSGGLAAAQIALEGVRTWGPDLLVHWRSYHRRRVRRSQRLCRALAGALRHPRLVTSCIRVLASAPGLAAPVLRGASRAPKPLSWQRA